MRYQGGKSRISKDIANIINKTRFSRYGNEGGCVVSLFCGTCSVESKLQGFTRKILNDKHEYLIKMLKAAQSGFEFPSEISKEHYQYLRKNKDDNKALAGFAGFGCSFGGIFFSSFAHSGRPSGENYALESKKSLLRDISKLYDAEFSCKDYRDVVLPDNAIIYADPPYNNTTEYCGEKFNSNEFWEYARDLSLRGHLVFISELDAPDDFVCIWQKNILRQLNSNKEKMFLSTEKLFIHEVYA